MPPVRHRQLTRCMDLLEEMAHRHFGMDHSEIAKCLGLSRRGMFRYMAALERAGVRFHKKKEYGNNDGFAWRYIYKLVDIRGMKLSRARR